MKAMETPDLLGNVEERLRKGVLAAALFGETHEAPRIGRFTLRQRIGAGAMGVVYEAFDAQLDRKVAIKLVRYEKNADARTNRLLREARAMAKLSHPHVVTVYEAGLWEGGLFVAMELVRGGTLHGWLEAQNRGVREILGMFLAAGRGLAAAHDAGLIHRDFKPENVLVGEDDRPRVADFGLVRIAGEIPLAEGPNPTITDGFSTVTGTVLGTPIYMAPEQIQGARVDAGADQFSFCVALYHALFGVFPFMGEASDDRLRKIQVGELTPPVAGHRVPGRIIDILRRGLLADPKARFPSMKTLLEALDVAERPGMGRWMSITGGALLCFVGIGGTIVKKEQTPIAPPVMIDNAAQKHDMALLSAARGLSPTDPTMAAVLLAEVEAPQRHREWSTLAQEVLAQPLARFVWHDARFAYSQPGNRVVILHDLDGNLIARSLENGRELLRRSEGEWGAVHPRGDELLVQTPQGLETWPLGQTTTTPSWHSDHAGLARVSMGNGGRDIFAMAKDGSVLHWDENRPTTSTVLRVIGDSHENVRAVLSANAGVAWIRTPNNEIEIWPLRGSGSPYRLNRGGKDFNELAVSHSAQWTAVGFHDGTMRIWPNVGGPSIEIRGHSSEIRHVRLDKKGERLVAWAADGTTRIWDLQTRQSREAPLVLPRHEANSAIVDNAGDMLVTTSPGTPGVARAWNLSTHEVSVLQSREDSGSSSILTPDGQWAVTSSIHNSARAWPLNSSSTALAFGHSAPIWAGERQGNRLATASQDGTARIWQIGEGGVLREKAVYSSAPATRVWTAVFSPGGERLATGSNDGKARIWKTDGSEKPVVLAGHEAWVYSLAFARDGQSLFTGSKRGCIRRFRVAGGAPDIVICKADVRGQVNQIVLSPAGDIGAAALASGHLVLWGNASNGDGAHSDEARAIPRAHGDLVHAVAFRPDGRQLVSVGRDRKVRLWDTASGALIRDVGSHDGAVYHVHMSPDGRRVVTSSADGTARIWSMDGESAPVILKGHEGWVVWAEFDRNGRRVVTAGYDGTARVWDLDEPSVPRVLRGHWGGIRYATFDEQGQRVITTAMDGTVRSWDVADESVERLQWRLREATRGCLTAAQRTELIGEDAATAAERVAACHR